MNKQPELTARTRQNIIDAFWSIYKEKTIDKITVSEITRITGNNRATFYHYFRDVYEVLETIEEELMTIVHKEIQGILNNEQFQEISRDSDVLYAISIPIFKEHGEKIFTLLDKNGNSKFKNKFRESIHTMLIKFWNVPQNTEYEDYLLEYAYSAMIGLMSKWYRSKEEMSDADFFKMAQGLIANGMIGFLTK